MNDDAIKSVSPANDNARVTVAPGVIGGIKSLFCEACCERPARIDGLCGDCMADMSAEIDGRRGGDEWL